ncbi:MAG: 16S rRNA (uracil(1498)-N(3))-methyltransferase [Rubrobacter sp.]|nr:16S rRNA (uracil(1498)-N(3))-methyltransferase [Rubrobacter sp.]
MNHSPQPNTAFALLGNEAHHLTDVLRAKPGDTFEVVGHGGRVFVAELLDGGEAFVVEEVFSEESESFGVVLYQAVPKGKRMDVVVEKAAELGATRIVPLVTDRSVVKAGEGSKLERWRRIAESAARQSLRTVVPEVVAPTPFREALEGAEGAILLHNGEGVPSLEEVVSSPASLFVGPEGGWSEAEMEYAGEVGAAFARIGPHRLRSETAGIAAVARAGAALEAKYETMKRER